MLIISIINNLNWESKKKVTIKMVDSIGLDIKVTDYICLDRFNLELFDHNLNRIIWIELILT